MTSIAARSEMPLDLGGFASDVEGLGPGRRAVVWVRGCSRGCPGCMAPELARGGTPSTVADAAFALAPLLDGASGLTVSGGEPFDQGEGVIALIDELRDSAPALEVLVYTGYELSELESGSATQRELLERIDILVDGPFVERLPNDLQWRGSDNQRVRLMSERARARYRGVTDERWTEPRTLRIQPITGTRLRVVGIPRRGDIARVEAMLAEHGAQMRVG